MLFQEEMPPAHIALWPALPYPPIPDCFGQFFNNPQKPALALKRSL
jgi:hypothetical protein